MYNSAGQYLIKITSNEHSNFLNLLQTHGNNGKIYTLAIKCGSGILVGRPSDSIGLNENWFVKLNSRLQYIKYAGEGANFPRISNCTVLKKVETVKPHTEIYRAARDNNFYNCYNLQKFDFSKCEKISNSTFSSSGFKEFNAPLLKNIPSNLFSGSNFLLNVNIGSCETIEEMAFRSCRALSEIKIPSCITVGSRALEYCYSLKSIYLPECTSIGDYAFNCCYTLEEIFAPKCTMVGESAFSDCYALKKVAFANNCTFGKKAFSYCYSLYPRPDGSIL